MFSKKKVPKRTQRSDNPFGLDLINNFDPNNMAVDDDDDDDLEAELYRLTTEDDETERRPRRPAPKPPMKPVNLDILKDEEIASDEELSGDDDDPDLLNELDCILGDKSSPETEVNDESPSEADKLANPNLEEIIKLLEERLELYKAAELKAKNGNESAKARRYSRGVKTIQGLLHDVKTGKNIDSSEIPPVLPRSATHADDSPPEEGTESTEAPQEAPAALVEKSSPDTPAPEPIPPPEIDNEKLELLKKRQHEYRIAAVAWKKSGNLTEAVNFMKIAKQFDTVIAALTSGQPVDLSDMPPTPQMPGVTASSDNPEQGRKEESETQEEASENSPAENSEPPPAEPAPITGDGIAGALKERLEVYRRTKTTAEGEGNSSKARRYGRICKQYEDAIKLHARGKPIPLDELPTPPGFPPIVTDTQPPPAVAPPKPEAQSEVPNDSEISEDAAKKPVVPPRVPKKPAGSATRAQKQTLLLQRRQAELKRAALTAKKEGDLEVARDYLRQAKGLDPLIEASNCGLPVDMTSIPLSPNAKAQLNEEDSKSDDSFAMLSSDGIQPSEISGTDQEIYENLESQLMKQKKVCLSTRDHAKALGDVPGYNKWERMALGYTRDLDMLRVRKREGLAPPQHHYEVKTYAIVQSCTDLTDNDLEMSIIRGINYPKEADTYVIYEFPYPSDSPPTDRTPTIRGTTNPEYDATFTLSIDRSARQCQRSFKRHALKCQVWSKGGFFRSDSLVGTVTIKLQPLETQCILHDSFPLMNGRKATGGKLEVKLRLRNPISTKQIEKMTDKWLIIDY